MRLIVFIYCVCFAVPTLLLGRTYTFFSMNWLEGLRRGGLVMTR